MIADVRLEKSYFTFAATKEEDVSDLHDSFFNGDKGANGLRPGYLERCAEIIHKQ